VNGLVLLIFPDVTFKFLWLLDLLEALNLIELSLKGNLIVLFDQRSKLDLLKELHLLLDGDDDFILAELIVLEVDILTVVVSRNLIAERIELRNG
jgi:hypothetical protein